MKNILLATTAMVMTAGVASAEITWTGTVTAGIARDGATTKTNGVITDAQIQLLDDNNGTSTVAGIKGTTALTDPNIGATMSATQIAAYRKANAVALAKLADEIIANATGYTAADAANLAEGTAWIATHQSWNANAAVLLTGNNVVIAGATYTTTSTASDTFNEIYDQVVSANTTLLEKARVNGINTATAAAVAGDYKTYSEVNMTGAVSLATDSGLTFKTAISIDAGTGYDLADDDFFDKTTSRNGGSVGLDFVSVGGAFGTITIDEGDISMLVDGDDDSGDIGYKGTFGDVTVQAVFDQLKDTNVTASAVTVKGVAGATATTTNQGTASDAGNGVDTAWSAAVSGTVQGVSYRYATDEEGGYAGSLGYTMSGVTVGLSTKLEAWEKDMNKPVHNGVSVAYAVEGLSINGAWDSVKDGNQTSWGVGYTGGDATVGFNTNEKNEWTATASLALGAGAALNAGVNYTDDAQIGVSFSF